MSDKRTGKKPKRPEPPKTLEGGPVTPAAAPPRRLPGGQPRGK